jgi:phosphoribosylglycinamide formyltransferase-1/phosphoribosylamine--glycine ligase/phosphoribosylglycinamide formyltransferase/phosphoribosylformylglycinamidine cyclo-ligase
VTDLDRLRALCLAQPRAVEKVSHGMPVFFIEKGRTFAWYVHDHHGDGITAVAIKTSGEDELAMLAETDPETYHRNKYLAPLGLVCLRIDRPNVDWAQVEARIERSWAHAATPPLREQFGR